jgi:SAM-dependent methyltransferase
MAIALTKRVADRDPLLGLVGWKGVLLYADPCTYDRWRWIERTSQPGAVRTLDAGSGNGAFAMYAAVNGNDATALSDAGPTQSRAERRAGKLGLEGVAFRVGDLRELDRLSGDLGRFDQVFCLEVIEHILDDRKLLRDLADVLRPGGRLLLTTPYRHHRPFYGETISQVEDGHHVRIGYTHEEMDGLLAEAGFAPQSHHYLSGVVSQTGFNLMYRLNRVYPHLGWIATLPLRLLRPLDRPLTRLTRYPHLTIGVVAVRA